MKKKIIIFMPSIEGGVEKTFFSGNYLSKNKRLKVNYNIKKI